MYKLMIVEDEEIIRKGIVKSINWGELGFEVIAEACNGSDCLEKIKIQRPDIVLTDVRMPVMDGLELARRVNESYKNIKIIILSGFSDFEIARSALKFQVYDYLLKPTDKKIFLETFKTLKEQLDKEYRELDNRLNQQKKLLQGLSKLRHEFLMNLIKGEVGPLSILQERLDFLELDFSGDNYAVAVISIDGDMKEILTEWKNEESLLIFSYSNIVQEILDVLNFGVVVVKDIREIIIIFNFKHEEINKQLMTNVIEQSISYIKLFKGQSLNIFAGIGLTYPGIDHISKSYIQANTALERKFFSNENYIFVYEECRETDIDSEKQWVNDYPNEINKIVSETVSGNLEKVEELIDQMFNHCTNEKPSSKFIKNYCYVMFFLINLNLSEIKVQLNTLDMFNTDFENDIKNICSIDDLKKYVKDSFTAVAKQIRIFKESKSGHHSKVIDSIKKYIDENYYKELSLEHLSKYAYLSPVYISFLFKSTTGENYMDYLKRVRLEKAKDLLRKADLKIYEVANVVGYSDYKYFAMQFKKEFGISPTEFRDGL